MYNLELALEALDNALENLDISDYHNVCDVSVVNECVYMMHSNDDIALEGILSKIKDFFTKSKDMPKEKEISSKDIEKTEKQLAKMYPKTDDTPKTISGYTMKIASQIYKDTNPFGPSIPLTFSWLCLTNFAELFTEFSKKNPDGFYYNDFAKYALENVEVKCGFLFRFYDRESKSVKDAFFTEASTNPYFKEVLGFTFKDAEYDCMIESFKKLLNKEGYEKYKKDGFPMAYAYTRTYMYEFNKEKGTCSLRAFKVNDDIMTGITFAMGNNEILYLPNKMDNEQMSSKVIKDLIAWK